MPDGEDEGDEGEGEQEGGVGEEEPPVLQQRRQDPAPLRRGVGRAAPLLCVYVCVCVCVFLWGGGLICNGLIGRVNSLSLSS
jgi:hypothetical protein